MKRKLITTSYLLLFPLSQIISGCSNHIHEQSEMLDACMTRQISNAEYITSRSTTESIIKTSHLQCQRELSLQGIKPLQQPKISQDQRLSYEAFIKLKIEQSPAYRFRAIRDTYKNEVSVKGIDYVENDGASEGYYTKASLSARKNSTGKIQYYIEIQRSGSERAELTTVHFKNGLKLAATPIGGNVSCARKPFCLWTEGAVAEIPKDLLTNGKDLDFKLTGRVDSDPVQFPGEYVSMFMSEVEKAM